LIINEVTMKKILFFLLLPTLLYGQLRGPMYFDKKVTIKCDYGYLIDLYTANIKSFEDVNGETVVVVPIERYYQQRVMSMFVDGYLAQYEWLPSGNDIVVHYLNTRVKEFDFKKDKITEKTVVDDSKCFDKPKDLKDKIKQKDKKK